MRRSNDDNAVKLNKEQMEFLEQHYRQFYGNLFGYAKSNLKSVALAEEAAQETFRRACENMDKFMSSPNPVGWLYNVIKNIINETRRERSKIYKLFNKLKPDRPPDEPVDFGEDRAVMALHYSGLLEPEDFSLLCRIAIDNCSMMEAAEEFGLTREACKKRVQRKSKELAEKLGEPY